MFSCIHCVYIFFNILALKASLYFISLMKFDSIWKKEMNLRKSAIEGNGHSGCGPEGRYVAGSRWAQVRFWNTVRGVTLGGRVQNCAKAISEFGSSAAPI